MRYELLATEVKAFPNGKAAPPFGKKPKAKTGKDPADPNADPLNADDPEDTLDGGADEAAEGDAGRPKPEGIAPDAAPGDDTGGANQDPTTDPAADPSQDPSVDDNGDPVDPNADPAADPNADPNATSDQDPTDAAEGVDEAHPHQWAGDLYQEGDETDPEQSFRYFNGQGGEQAWLDRADDGTLTGWVRDGDGSVYRYSDPDAWAVDVDDAHMQPAGGTAPTPPPDQGAQPQTGQQPPPPAGGQASGSGLGDY